MAATAAATMPANAPAGSAAPSPPFPGVVGDAGTGVPLRIEGTGVGAGAGVSAAVGTGFPVIPVPSTLPPAPPFGVLVDSGLGIVVGTAVGTKVGSGVGTVVGTAVGSTVGSVVGTAVGRTVGSGVGAVVGAAVGTKVGTAVDTAVGNGDPTPPPPPSSPPPPVGVVTLTIRIASPRAPLLSVTVNIMVWLPLLSKAAKDSPVPIGPLMSDVQTREAPTRLPSSASFPEPLKTILSVVRKVA